jgi:hypothetical protein
MPNELPSSVVADVQFVGRSGGTVKALGGFKKGHHTLPDAANATTNAFLGKICAAELAQQAEALFQRVRSGLAYKRRDISLAVNSPGAVLSAKDFTVEILYELEEADPARYAVTTALRGLRNAELARTEEFSAIFSRMFSEIRFELKKGARVEAVIDVIENLEGEAGLEVTYPSDCRECTIGVAGVEAQVRCTGSALEIVFPQPGSPGELLEKFGEIRAAFEISRELGGMLG